MSDIEHLFICERSFVYLLEKFPFESFACVLNQAVWFFVVEF